MRLFWMVFNTIQCQMTQLRYNQYLFEVGMLVIPQLEVIEAQSVLGVGIDVRGFGFDPIKEAVEAIVISLAIFIA